MKYPSHASYRQRADCCIGNTYADSLIPRQKKHFSAHGFYYHHRRRQRDDLICQSRHYCRDLFDEKRDRWPSSPARCRASSPRRQDVARCRSEHQLPTIEHGRCMAFSGIIDIASTIGTGGTVACTVSAPAMMTIGAHRHNGKAPTNVEDIASPAGDGVNVVGHTCL